MAELQYEDLKIHYLDQGTGAPVLLIHGHTLDRRVWNGVADRLVEAGRRVIRPDLRGHGLSSRPESGFHWIHHAADMAAVLDEVEVDRLTIVGFSLGGGVALEMALAMDRRLDGLVLLSPVMPDRPFEPEFMDNLREVARAVRSEGVRSAMLGPWAASPLFAASMRKPEVVAALEEIVRDFPGADYLATARDRVERDWKLPDRLAEITAPTRVAVGSEEMAGFRAFADEAAAGIPGATLEVLEGCGHLLPLEAPQRVAEIILGS